MLLVNVFYQIFLFIGDPILLGSFKLVDEALDMLSTQNILEVEQMQTSSCMTDMNYYY